MRLDLGASARILIAAMVSALFPIAILQLHLTEHGVVNLILGGGLYLVTYLTVAPIMRAISESDIANLETILCRTRIVATFLRPGLRYAKRILYMIRKGHE